MTASLVTFAVGLGIRFGLTPYIVQTLGPEAYGFIGLSANILSYTGLITIALNSMAGRFITVSYCAKKIDEANKYYSSVFFSNIILAMVIAIIACGCILWLDKFINIPCELINDVKWLFIFLTINNLIGLLSGTWAVATFVKNRLDLSNIQAIIGNIINALFLAILFSFFKPHVWYIGIAGLFQTLYTASTNYIFMGKLTPDLILRRTYFELIKIKELLKSGLWNLISKLGDILGHGLDLLIANLCIGSVEMGIFAITKNVPFLILSLFQSISAVFAPTMTRFFAENKREKLLNECYKSIRILSFFTAIPLSCLYVYGDCFYKLWLPSEDSYNLLYLTILGTFALPYTLPLESLWNIFTITNKLKYSTIFMVANNVVVFVIVMTSMIIVESHEIRLWILAGTRSICGVIRGFIFLPMYGGHCLNSPKMIFYKIIIKSLAYISISLLCCFTLKIFFTPQTWTGLIVAFILVGFICSILGIIFVLKKTDRDFLVNKIRKLAHGKHFK